jgi:hypothetical protein
LAPERDDVAGGSRKPHNKELHFVLFTKYYKDDQIKEDMQRLVSQSAAHTSKEVAKWRAVRIKWSPIPQLTEMNVALPGYDVK